MTATTGKATTTFRNEELMLDVKTDFDPQLLNLDAYEAFIDALCPDRPYQQEAIRTVCRLLAGGQYTSTRQLATENYANNPALSDRYGSLDGLLSSLPFPDKLACTVDLATGTGKTWVMYGVARILLASGIVDRVLVLCPSLTIETGLTVRFKQLSGDSRLLDLIPSDAVYRSPNITDANDTTGPGDICIENIAATYKHVRSSVRDSFEGRGSTTLVLNDETHHVFTPTTGDRAIKRWKEFLDDDEFGFTRIVGFSGTCYSGNDYLPDVVARYSLRTAMEQGRVKEVRYVSKDESTSQEERFQKYLELHRKNQSKHRSLKPLSILITAKVAAAQELADEFTRFLSSENGVSLADAQAQVLVVTSHKDHRTNLAKLGYVDRPDNPIQWIFSVSMLTEGWDVQNVFQIVPHEKRAFASKLLIAQVLGRGLRVPPGLSRPAVTVFNHSSWSSEITGLVDEVLEQERRLRSYAVENGERAKYHFDVHQLTYKTRTTEQELQPTSSHVQLFKRGYVNFESQPESLDRTTTFTGALDGEETYQTTSVHYRLYAVDEVVQKLWLRLKSIDQDGETSYAKEYPRSALKKVIERSLAEISETRGVVSEQNLQHAYRAMGNTQRKSAKAARIERDPDKLTVLSTRDMRAKSVGIGSFRREATAFYDSESSGLSEESDQRSLAEITDEEGSYLRQAASRIDNSYRFKTPVNVVLTTHAPERSFVRRLFDPKVAEQLDAWIKSPDTGFYEIGYSWRKGDHTKQGRFNPDMIIKLAGSNDILVVELKDDGDATDENRAKLRFATDHFTEINALQSDATYHIKFISPQSFDAFFQSLAEGKSSGFVSTLHAALRED